MNYRSFGRTGLAVSELGLGCSRLGGTIEHRDDREVLATIDEAVASGIRFFDTADIYGQGRAEELLGRALERRRDAVVIAGKAGYRLSRAGRLAARLKPLVRPLARLLVERARTARESAYRVRDAQIGQEFSPDGIRRAIEGSLRRLRTDYLDIFQLHDPPPAVMRADGLFEMLERLRGEGKIRHYGVSARTVAEAREWVECGAVASLQLRVNLHEFEDALAVVNRAAARGLGVIARQPLASGKFARFDGYSYLARDGSRTMAQAALAFALQLPDVSTVIAGMNSRAHLRENLAAPALSEEELERIYKKAIHVC